MKFLSRPKKTKEVTKDSNVIALSKEMLKKVEGGGGGTSAPISTDAAVVKSKSNITNN